MASPAVRRHSTWRAALSTLLGAAVAALGLALIAARLATGDTTAGLNFPIASGGALAIGGVALVAETLEHRRLAAGLAALLFVAMLAALARAATAGTMLGGPLPSTAIALLVVSLAIPTARRRPATARALGVAVLALTAFGAAGQVLATRAFVTTMPLTAAFGTALLGLGIAVQPDVRGSRHADLAERYTPYAAGATCLLATVLFWQSLIAHQRAELQRVVEMTAVGSLAELSAFVRSVTRALDHIADEWNAAGRLPAAQWRYQCRLVIERLGGPRALEWIDDDLDVVYVVTPAKTAGPVGARDAAPPVNEAERAAFAAARNARQPMATPTFVSTVTAADRAEFRLVAPLFRRGTPDGFVSALFYVDDMLDDLLATRIHDYDIAVSDGDRQIYGPRMRAPNAACPTCRSYTLDLPGGRRWDFVIRPSAELRDSIETGFPEMILVSGILISILLTAMLQVLARERRMARDLVQANRSLHEEVASRRVAEQEIRTLATELEQRVRDRTAELASSNIALRNENGLRQRAQATLEAANRNLRQFASFVSHELRQPLATMALWSELLDSNPDAGLTDRGRGYVKQLRSAIDRMTAFLEAQLRLARVTYTQPTLEEHVDVAALVREVVADGTLGLRHAGATVEIGDVPNVHADSAQLRQLFRNLLENAVKYRRPNAPLLVRIEGAITSRNGTRHCEIRVIDNGQGFAEADAEKIFDLFEQLPGRKSAGAGSGVGLAICRRIVEHHGGTIRAEGHPDTGATFIIDLPLERCEGHPKQPAEVVCP